MNRFILLLGLLPLAAQADWGQRGYEDDTKPWAELQAQMPPAPRQEGLLPFEVSAITTNRFYIDPASVSVGSDGIVRYTLVVRSSEGASNVSYEGIRCDTAEVKRYAFGRPDGSWSPAREPKWQRIHSQTLNPQHKVLFADFFCPVGIIVGSAKEAIGALKQGGHPRSRNSSSNTP